MNNAIQKVLTRKEAELALKAFLREKEYHTLTHPWEWARWDDLPRPCWSVWVSAYTKNHVGVTLGIQIYDDGEVAINYRDGLDNGEKL